LRLAAWYGVEHSDAPGALGQRTWLTGVGFAVVALVVVANAGSATGLGSSGGALVVVVGVAVYAAAALVFLMWFDAPRPLTVGLLLVMGAAATAHAPRRPGGHGRRRPSTSAWRSRRCGCRAGPRPSWRR
jgi:hypothetical protein